MGNAQATIDGPTTRRVRTGENGRLELEYPYDRLDTYGNHYILSQLKLALALCFADPDVCRKLREWYPKMTEGDDKPLLDSIPLWTTCLTSKEISYLFKRWGHKEAQGKYSDARLARRDYEVEHYEWYMRMFKVSRDEAKKLRSEWLAVHTLRNLPAGAGDKYIQKGTSLVRRGGDSRREGERLIKDGKLINKINTNRNYYNNLPPRVPMFLWDAVQDRLWQAQVLLNWSVRISDVNFYLYAFVVYFGLDITDFEQRWAEISYDKSRHGEAVSKRLLILESEEILHRIFGTRYSSKYFITANGHKYDGRWDEVDFMILALFGPPPDILASAPIDIEVTKPRPIEEIYNTLVQRGEQLRHIQVDPDDKFELRRITALRDAWTSQLVKGARRTHDREVQAARQDALTREWYNKVDRAAATGRIYTTRPLHTGPESKAYQDKEGVDKNDLTPGAPLKDYFMSELLHVLEIIDYYGGDYLENVEKHGAARIGCVINNGYYDLHDRLKRVYHPEAYAIHQEIPSSLSNWAYREEEPYDESLITDWYVTVQESQSDIHDRHLVDPGDESTPHYLISI